MNLAELQRDGGVVSSPGPYVAQDNRTYVSDFTNDEGLYRVAEAPAIAKEGSFAELQEQAGLALTWQDIEEARAAIKAMKEFVAMAEGDLEKLIAWTRSSEETLR